MNASPHKELILINPCISSPYLKLIQRIAMRKTIPYALLTLAALTPRGYKIKIFNQKLFWLNKDYVKGVLVGISCLTASVDEAYKLADRFRKAGAFVVLGGPHACALPEEALQHAYSVVIGEAESVWPSVVEDFEKNQLKKIYQGVAKEDFFSNIQDYLLHLKPRILSIAGVHTSRGCKYNCDFCAKLSANLRFIPVGQVVALARKIKETANFFNRRPLVLFRSDNIFSSPAYAKELFKALTPLKIKWGANCSVDIGFDNEALSLAQKSGCIGFLIGFETIYPQDYQKTSLRQITSFEDYRKAIKNIQSRGIKINGSFIVGFDHYRPLDYLRLLWFLIRSGLWYSGITILTPFPGSPLFERLKAENRIRTFDWRKYTLFRCVFKPKGMSVFALYACFYFVRIFSVIFSRGMIILFLTCLVINYLAYNLSYRLIGCILP